MSLNSAIASAVQDGSSASPGLVQLAVPRLVSGRYAEWRPLMENHLLRAGVTTRDYREENKDWAALVKAVEDWARADEDASVAYALGRSVASASASSSSKGQGPSSAAAEKEMRRGAMELVGRTKKAYTLLYAALSEELRQLVEHVPQGDAFGLWSWLERRFQNTEQDNIGDLWDKFTTLSQGEEETFDQYKARVDRVYHLLAHAKDKPSMGQYTHRLLWKLNARHKSAVLALKAADKLKDADKINWMEIVNFINDHERDEQRLNAVELDPGNSAMAVQGRGRGGGFGAQGALAGIECFNCSKMGHLARNCREPRRARRHQGAGGQETRDQVDEDEEREDDDDGGDRRTGRAHRGEAESSKIRSAGGHQSGRPTTVRAHAIRIDEYEAEDSNSWNTY